MLTGGHHEKKKDQGLLDYSILTAKDVEVEEVKTNKTGIRKYKIELSEEDMKRLFYRNINDEYISMIINQPGAVYLSISTTTGYLTQVDIDLSDIVDMQDPDSRCEKMKLEMKYQEYNNLDVPVPPVVNDYQKTVYILCALCGLCNNVYTVCLLFFIKRSSQ